MIDSRRPRRWATVLIAAAAFCAAAATAQLIPGYRDDVKQYDQRDLSLLPPYCKYTQDFRERVEGGNDRVQAARWEATLGEAFLHLHHYCWGLMKANRGLLLATSDFSRRHYLNDAVREFDYVIERSSKDFILLPEMLSRRGQAQLRLGDVPSGLASIERAISLKPDYWPPYAHASDFYKRQGDLARSRQWLKRGLEKMPDSNALTTRLAALEAPGREGGNSKR